MSINNLEKEKEGRWNMKKAQFVDLQPTHILSAIIFLIDVLRENGNMK